MILPSRILERKLRRMRSVTGGSRSMGETSVADGKTIRSRVIGVRHPSYPWFNPVKDLKLHLQQSQGVLAGTSVE